MSGINGHDELSRFTASGKTFFFNKMKAKNGGEYLSVNALFGQGNHERITLFEPQLIQFVKHSQRAVEALTGLTYAKAEPSPLVEAPADTIPTHCPACGTFHQKFGVSILNELGKFMIFCGNCGETIR